MLNGKITGRLYATIEVRDVGDESKFVEKKAPGELSQWEKDIIMRIARKLAAMSLDIPIMFGIFSRG